MAKTVIVTGGSTGIGKAISLKFADQGYNVVLNYLGETPVDLIAEIEGKGVLCKGVEADISQFDQAEMLVKTAKESFGTIDVLVNNAGIAKDRLIIRMSEDDFDDVIRVNLKGAFNTIRHVSNIMLKQKSGAIVNMASIIGLVGNVGQANYAASKAGLIGLTKSTAKELAMRGITCNAIAPGYIETPMTSVLPDEIKQKMGESIPLKRFGQPHEVAELAYFLANSPYITGQVVNIDGGMVM